MFNPLSLRLCCLATMAPALTSEAATRTRDKLPAAPTPPVAQVSLSNGRDCEINSASKGGGDLGSSTLPPSVTNSTQLITITKDLQRKLVATGHLSGVENSLQVTAEQQQKTSQIGIVSLGSISSISEVYRRPSQEVKLCNTSVLHPQQLNQIISSISANTMATTKSQASCTTTSTSSAPVNGINSSSSSQITMVQSKMALPGSTQPPILPRPTPAARKTSMISDPRLHEGLQKTGVSSTGTPASQKAHDVSSSQHGNELSNGFHSLSHKITKSDQVTKHTTTTSQTAPAPSTSATNVSVVVDQKNCLASKKELHSTQQLLENVARRQRQIETRTSRLLRQLRRLQSRQAISHTKQQLGGLVEHEQQTLQVTGKSRSGNMDLKTELMQRQNAKNMSTAALVSLIQKWQCTQTTSLRQQLSMASQEPVPVTKLDEDTCTELDRVAGHLECNLSHLQSGMDSDATESSSGGESCEELDYDDDWDSSVSRPPIQCRAEWKWAGDRSAVAARWTWLQAQVSDLEYRIRQQYDIYKQIRANKGSVTLGEQVLPEDLMSKSRNEKSGKKLSPLDEKIANLQAKNEISPSTVSTLLSNVDKQSSRMSQQIGPLYTPVPSPSTSSTTSGSCLPTPKTPNGFVDSKSICVTPEESSGANVSRTNAGFESPAVDYTCQAARCRPVRSYRKRKLLRTAGLHNISRKAARLSTVQCHCYPPVTPCAMCGGRYNNCVQMEAETMPYMEKVALADFSYHPVLSFPQDVGLSTHFDSMLKTGEWQQKPHPKTYKVLQAERKRTKLKDTPKKYPRKLNKGTPATILSSTSRKIRNKYEQKQLNRNQTPGSPVKGPATVECKKLSRSAIRARNRKTSSENQKNSHDDGSLGKDGTLSGAHPTLKELWLRKKRERERGESAYDINNIVIPYSIAASTRVEKLQYKEILTPKWRKITENERQEKPSAEVQPEEVTEPPKSPEKSPAKEEEPKPEKPEKLAEFETNLPSEDEEAEDVSDEVFRNRHIRCEISEKKRFSIPASSAALRRSRGAQRTDSTTSLTTTEPGSPFEAMTGEGSLVSQTATPPSTPAATLTTMASVDDDEPVRRESSSTSINDMRARSSSVSSSKSIRSRSTSCGEDIKHLEFPSVQPWTPRTFPLDTDDLAHLDRDGPLPRREKVSSAKVIAQEMTPTPAEKVPMSPTPCGSDSSLEVPEDPDDPEWTVISEKPVNPKLPNIVLKLTKR